MNRIVMVSRTRATSLLTVFLVFFCSTSLHVAFSTDASLARQHVRYNQIQSIRRGQSSTKKHPPKHTWSLSLAPESSSEWMPLYLSSLAGASTCLGAALVFLHPNQKGIAPSTMSFSLALAGSVMVTISILSLGPECLQDPSGGDEFRIIPLWSSLFAE